MYITTFFSETGAFVQWARAGNGRYVKHLGMSVDFLFYFSIFWMGWDYVVGRHAYTRTKNGGGGRRRKGSYFAKYGMLAKNDPSFT